MNAARALALIAALTEIKELAKQTPSAAVCERIVLKSMDAIAMVDA